VILLEKMNFVDWHPLKALMSPCNRVGHQSCAGALALFKDREIFPGLFYFVNFTLDSPQKRNRLASKPKTPGVGLDTKRLKISIRLQTGSTPLFKRKIKNICPLTPFKMFSKSSPISRGLFGEKVEANQRSSQSS
jgi:hypothetical protein